MALTVIIPVLDEAPHIARCLASIGTLARRIIVIDAGSTDGTADIASSHGAEVLFHKWSSDARQINWAIDTAGITTEWTFLLHADEVVLPPLAARLADLAVLPDGPLGFTVRRRFHFLGRWLRRGGLYPERTLRLWRTGHGHCEDRLVGTRMIVHGRAGAIPADIAAIDLHNIGWWTDRQNDHATREALAQLHDGWPSGAVGGIPVGIRAPAVTLWRYLVRLGCLDGWEGLVYCVLQTGWFRFLVDIKKREVEALMAERQHTLNTVAADEYGIRLIPLGINGA
ncbi:MAG: glycosyltransferase family 2 protein [Alphaproteobacteria bacterium]|nr:MAG: glycosyltransferase family 2 protein [Alphaproteobacteria bacterium]